MTNRPKVSVIIPTCNRRELVQIAIRSALEQSVPAAEILVVDDGSTDGTAAAVAHFPAPVKYISRPHGGPGAARNAGIRSSSGEWIALLDADDQWTPDKLERTYAAIAAAPQWDVIFSLAATFTHTGKLLAPRSRPPQGWILADLFRGNCIPGSTAVFRRRIWERLGGFSESLPTCVAHHFWLRAAVAHEFGLIPEATTIIGQPPDALSSDRSRQLRVQAEMLHQFYEEQGSQRLDWSLVSPTMGRLCRQAAILTAQQGDWALSARHYRGAAMYQPSWRSRLAFLRAERRRQRAGLPAIETPALR